MRSHTRMSRLNVASSAMPFAACVIPNSMSIDKALSAKKRRIS